MITTNKNPIFVGKSGNQDFGTTLPQPLPGANNATSPKLSKNVPSRLKLKVTVAQPQILCRSEKKIRGGVSIYVF